MIYVGIDDTDTLDSPGTNQLARALAAEVAGEFCCRLIVRHQLLCDPRVPCTSKNGSASLLFDPRGRLGVAELVERLRRGMRERFTPGSDPGLCVADSVPQAVAAFGKRCQNELVRQDEARRLATAEGLHLEGLGGTEDGVIGALAAVGLIAGQNDGRVVHIGKWPDNLSGSQPIGILHDRGVAVRQLDSGASVDEGQIDVGKHLRPNLRGGRIVLFVNPATTETAPACAWQAVRLL
jgi:hypothetical protein